MLWVVPIWRLLLAALVVAAVLLRLSSRPALACGAGPDFNPIEASEVIVAGQIADWERAEDARVHPASYAMAPIRVRLTVQRVLKGNAPAQLTLVDHASLLNPDTHPMYAQLMWAGGAGGCGSFDEDPTGRSAVMGLRRLSDGTYEPNRLLTFYLGDEPVEAVIDDIVAWLVRWGPITLPPTGTGGAAMQEPRTSVWLSATVLPVVMLVVVGLAFRGRLACDRNRAGDSA